jgi:hypothetical protein
MCFGCDTCDIDICQKCHDKNEKAGCTHKLFDYNVPHVNFPCILCHINQEPGKVLYGCQTCGILTCDDCHHKIDDYENSISKILKVLDLETTGAINLKDLGFYNKHAAKVLSQFDVDGNGVLTIDELKQFIHSDDLAGNILQQLQSRTIDQLK